MEKIAKELILITQNVDGLHHISGNQNIVELHGNIKRNRCFDEDVIIEKWEGQSEIPPRCPECGGYLHPDVVWFGENLNPNYLKKTIKAARNCNMFFSIGTSSVVEPAVTLPDIAKEAGAVLVDINTQETKLSDKVDFLLRGYAGVIVPNLVKQTWNVNI